MNNKNSTGTFPIGWTGDKITFETAEDKILREIVKVHKICKEIKKQINELQTGKNK